MSKYLLLRSMLVALIFAVSANGQDASPLTLSRVVSRYIQRNLELQAERYRLERTRADAIAARMRPNPSLSVIAEKLKVSGLVPASQLYEVGATYSETIELGGKRKLREQVAAGTISAAEARFADAMRKGIAEVKRLYSEAVPARRDIEVATEKRQIVQQLEQFQLARFP